MNDDIVAHQRGEAQQADNGPTYVLTPIDADAEQRGEGGSSMLAYILVMWRHRLLILTGTVLCGALALLVSLFLPKAYEARASLVILPPQFRTELKPPVLSVHTYKTIIESEAIKRKLAEAVSPTGNPNEDMQASLAAVVYIGRQRDQAYIPLIDLVVEAPTPERAGLIADTWADIVVREVGDLSSRTEKDVVDFIEGEYPEAQLRLNTAELELRNKEDEHDQLIRQLEERFDSRIAEFRVRWNLEAMASELQTLEGLLTGPEDGLLVRLEEVQLSIRRAQDRLAELKKEIAKHPQFLTLSKAITDDALWQRVGKDASGDLTPDLEVLRLKSEALNPTHERLAEQLADTQINYESLGPQEAFLKQQIGELRRRISELNELTENKRLEFRKLMRDRDTQLRVARRARAFEVRDLERKASAARKTFDTLSDKYQSALLAKVEESSDLQIGAPAVADKRPTKPKILLNTALGLALGLALAVGLAFLLDFAAPVFSPSRSPRSLVGRKT